MTKLSRRAFLAAATAGAIAAPVAAKVMPEIKPGRVKALPFVPFVRPPTPVWDPHRIGDPLDHYLTVADFLLSGHTIGNESIVFGTYGFPSWLRFYYGEQWSADVEHQREISGRPTLTVNMLPRILNRALFNTRACGEREPNDSEVRELKAIIAMRNRDAQLMYNAQASALHEYENLMPYRYVFVES